jgi:hypothetical protein
MASVWCGNTSSSNGLLGVVGAVVAPSSRRLGDEVYGASLRTVLSDARAIIGYSYPEGLVTKAADA